MPARTVVLVFSATAGYRHESIGAGAAAPAELAAPHGLRVLHTEDPADLRPDVLGGCAAVVFLSPTGDVLDEGARAALRGYVTGGGGFLGVHAAACAEYGWPYYGELLGARFERPPRDPAGDGDRRGRRPPGHRPPAAELAVDGRVVRLPRGAR